MDDGSGRQATAEDVDRLLSPQGVRPRELQAYVEGGKCSHCCLHIMNLRIYPCSVCFVWFRINGREPSRVEVVVVVSRVFRSSSPYTIGLYLSRICISQQCVLYMFSSQYMFHSHLFLWCYDNRVPILLWIFLIEEPQWGIEWENGINLFLASSCELRGGTIYLLFGKQTKTQFSQSNQCTQILWMSIVHMMIVLLLGSWGFNWKLKFSCGTSRKEWFSLRMTCSNESGKEMENVASAMMMKTFNICFLSVI